MAGGTLLLGSPGALGATPVAMTVGAQTANATTATFDLYGNDTTLSTPERLVAGRDPEFLCRATLWVNVPANSTTTYAGTITDGRRPQLELRRPRHDGPHGQQQPTRAARRSAAAPSRWATAAAAGTIPLPCSAIVNNGTPGLQPRRHRARVSGRSAAPGGVLQTGPGTVILTAYNNYSGGTTVTGGTSVSRRQPRQRARGGRSGQRPDRRLALVSSDDGPHPARRAD